MTKHFLKGRTINLIFSKKQMKKILIISGIFLVLSSSAMPVFAQNTSSAIVVSTSEKITCVKTAVTTRENAIKVAVSAHAQAIHDASATRVLELAGTHSNTNAKVVRVGIKVAWLDFIKSTKSASAKWKTSRNAAWSAFRVAVKACKAPVGVSDPLLNL